jgi:RimJ/RimL family protein N-acetyltransferase
MKDYKLTIAHQIETKNLVIKPLTQGMAIDLHKAIHASLDVFQPWFDWANPAPSLVDVQERTAKNIVLQNKQEAFFFSVYLKEGGQFVGRLSFDRLNPDVPSYNFAGWCHKDYIGQGYMGEAGRVLLNWAINDLKCKRIESYHDSENTRSKQAIQVLVNEFGFKKLCVLENKERRKFDNTLRHHILYAFTQT